MSNKRRRLYIYPVKKRVSEQPSVRISERKSKGKVSDGEGESQDGGCRNPSIIPDMPPQVQAAKVRGGKNPAEDSEVPEIEVLL